MEAVLNTPSGRMPLGIAIIKIGSAQDNQLILNDPKASPLHAGIRPEEHGYSITDLGSASGTFLNGQQLDYNAPRLLYPGDTIRIGDTIFTYEMNSVPLPAAPFPGNTGHIMSSGYSPSVAAAGSLYDASYAQGVFSGGFQPSSVSSTYVASPTGPAAAQPQPPLTVPLLLRKENRHNLWIALGIFAAVLLVGFIVFSNLHSPQRTLDTYCNALQSGDYQTAYNQLSPGFQGFSRSEADFANTYSNSGRVLSCSYSAVSVSGNSATATLMIVTSSSGSGTSTSQVVLVQDSNFNWKIDGYKL